MRIESQRRRFGRVRGLVALVALGTGWALYPATASADDWPTAQVAERFSESREWFVRVVPANSFGDVVGFSNAATGTRARALWYRWDNDQGYRLVREATLLNPVAPVEFFVTDRGMLATLDNWHNVGYGSILASYDAAGQLVATYTLRDLFSEEEVGAFPTSVSSVWWRGEKASVDNGQGSVYVALRTPGEALLFAPDTGRWQVCQWQGSEYRCRSANAARDWEPFR